MQKLTKQKILVLMDCPGFLDFLPYFSKSYGSLHFQIRDFEKYVLRLCIL